MLQYLVTSKARRRLLMLLWRERRRGSVSELAEQAGVSFSNAHGELKAMQDAQLVRVHYEDGRDVYEANLDHPGADALRALMADEVRVEPPSTHDDELLKRSLVALGAPLRNVKPVDVEVAAATDVLVRGALLSRRDPVVARCMPIGFWKQREMLALKKLDEQVSRAEDKHVLGFFLELAGELGGDRRLVGLAEHFRDGRMTSLRNFFRSSTLRERLFREFPLAEKWGFRMNTDLDSFRSLFEKFVTK